jgi:hypothetical protein
VSYHAFRGYETSKLRRYIAIWDLQWKVIDSHQIEAGADLRAAFTAAIERARAQGWAPEAEAPFGFVFIRNDSERRLMALTPRDPHDNRPQTFNPFRRG